MTPNGSLTSDSYEKDSYYEGYLTNRFVQNGTYVFIASLYADPNDFRPLYDFVHRVGQTSEFEAEYDPNYPRLSTEHSWRDGELSGDSLAAGVYTDLQVAFIATAGQATVAQQHARPGALPSLSVVRGNAARKAMAGRTITRAQIATIDRMLRTPRTRGVSRPSSGRLP